MNSSQKDVAEFFRHTLHLGLSKQAEVAKWADQLLAKQKHTDAILMELSNATQHHPTDLIRMLGEISGTTDKASVGKMVFARIAKSVEEQKMTVEQFLQISMSCLPNDTQLCDLLNTGHRNEFFDLVQAWDVVELSGLTKSAFNKRAINFLSQFRSFDLVTT